MWLPTTFVVRTPAYRKEGNVCKGNLSRVSLARSVTRPQATGFALQNRTNTKKDTLLRVFFRVGTPDWIRTSGLQSRSLSLYPAELRAHIRLSLTALLLYHLRAAM